MTVTAVRKDPQTLTLTLEAEFDAPPDRVLAAVGRSAPARALVGSADLPGDRRRRTTCAPAAASSTT